MVDTTIIVIVTTVNITVTVMTTIVVMTINTTIIVMTINITITCIIVRKLLILLLGVVHFGQPCWSRVDGGQGCLEGW